MESSSDMLLVSLGGGMPHHASHLANYLGTALPTCCSAVALINWKESPEEPQTLASQ